MKYFGAAWSDLRGRERREIMAWTGQERKGKERNGLYGTIVVELTIAIVVIGDILIDFH
jgi:hypothetical protein